MQVLKYANLLPGKFQAKYDKVVQAIERDDFRSVDLKKLSPSPYYRVRLDDASRLLLQFVRHGERTACLALEIVPHHAYDKSRFLRGARVDESRIEDATPEQAAQFAAPVRYLHPGGSEFHLLDKPISFDDAQEAVYRLPPPLILVGSAGSGKTALTLEKLRQCSGEVLYVTQSPWLARNARALYDAHGYENAEQQVQFLSYREFLETLRVPPGREVNFADFRAWFARHRQQYRFTDAHPCFEEFRGVIGSQPEGVLDREAYLALGPRQSIFETDQRQAIHALFDKYRQWLADSGLYDSNLIAHAWRPLAQPQYDFVVIDEVQDLTNAQLALVLSTLRDAGQFLLCGDSNQIVHPNFFSWAAVKSLFWRSPELAQRQALSVLGVNYRNTRAITAAANALLKIKHARFGSIDRESNHLVRAAAESQGQVRLLADQDAVKRDLDARTRDSTQFAVLVLRDEDKADARAVFRTPLVFSVHEAKGLEYPNIILYRFISGQRRAYAELCEGVSLQDLEGEELDYRRAKDKQDRSLELWKFYVNALYVAMTRAVERLYLVESDLSHPLLQLLGIQQRNDQLEIQTSRSSREEWEREAHRLALQGKQEQADAIRASVLKTSTVPWPVWDAELLQTSIERAYAPHEVSNKPRQLLADMAQWHYLDGHLLALHTELAWPGLRGFVHSDPVHGIRYDPARLKQARATLAARFTAGYDKKNFKPILQHCDQYGVDHLTVVGATPLMLAAEAGNTALVEALLDRGADPEVSDLFGHTAQSFALARAARDADYACGAFDEIWQRVSAAALDVEVDGRLLRVYRQQGEYLLLQLMLTGLKTLGSLLYNLPDHDVRRLQGFDAAYLMRNIEHFPEAVWSGQRHKRTYFNAVLARAEIDSTYQPARKLWRRTRNGHYLPNPDLRLRVRGDDGQQHWQPVYEVLQLPMIERGNGRIAWQPGQTYRMLLGETGLGVQDNPPRIPG